MRTVTLALLALMMITLTCSTDPNERLQEGRIIDDKYYAERFGLTVDIPAGWRLISSLEEEFLRQEGREAAAEEFGENRADNWTNLLQLQKGASLNQLTFNYLNHNPAIHGDYLQSRTTRFYGMKASLENTPGVEIESVATVTELDGVDFETFNMLIRKNGEIKGYQILLEKKYDNDEVLLISVTTTDRETLEELRSVIDNVGLARKR